ncbi:MAG: type II secretion system F family protein [Anaerolineales bacterium]|nr:type II secretion system F family protein [Anaerolineales bacterium]
MQVIIGLGIGLLLILLGPLLMIISLRWFTTDDVSHRLEEFTGARGGLQNRLSPEIYARRLGITGSFVERTITPFLRRIAKLFGRLTPAQAMGATEHRLMLAGQPFGLGAREYFGVRLLFLLTGAGLALLLLRLGFEVRNIVGAVLSMVVCYLLPIVWLRRLIRERQNNLIKSLPDALDMLSVCATAGLGFDQAMQRVSEFWHTSMGHEFGRVISEMEMGVSRSEALRNLAYRSDVKEISSFVSIIVQAEQLGMSISNTINSIAQQMRIERRFKAQEQARKLPNKIVFPLAFFIFPSMIAVILGPSVPALLDLFAFIR